MTWTRKTRRRLFGAICLGAAALMLVVGDIKPAQGSSHAGFVIYWVTCFVFAALAMATAILDLGAVRREARAEQRELLEKTLGKIESRDHCSAAAAQEHRSDPPSRI